MLFDVSVDVFAHVTHMAGWLRHYALYYTSNILFQLIDYIQIYSVIFFPSPYSLMQGCAKTGRKQPQEIQKGVHFNMFTISFYEGWSIDSRYS